MSRPFTGGIFLPPEMTSAGFTQDIHNLFTRAFWFPAPIVMPGSGDIITR
ncbi:hypothetical protein [Pectobacterium parmentieri]|nr:hypothetical protein [Pectobacterium parmentieri]